MSMPGVGSEITMQDLERAIAKAREPQGWPQDLCPKCGRLRLVVDQSASEEIVEAVRSSGYCPVRAASSIRS